MILSLFFVGVMLGFWGIADTGAPVLGGLGAVVIGALACAFGAAFPPIAFVGAGVIFAGVVAVLYTAVAG